MKFGPNVSVKQTWKRGEAFLQLLAFDPRSLGLSNELTVQKCPLMYI